MDARRTVDRRRRQTPVDRRRHDLDTWLHACDICVEPATNPVAVPCGHLFCSACLDDAFVDGLVSHNSCPICDAEFPDETAQNFPIVDSAGPTRARRTITSDAATTADNNNNIARIEPRAAADMLSNTSVISEARMDVVQDMLDVERERTHTRQVDQVRHFSNLRGQRIRGLEQAFDTVVQMNVDLLREMENRDEDIRRLRGEMENRGEDIRRFRGEMENRGEENRRLRRRIAELENPIAGVINTTLGMTSIRYRRFGRRITPTPLATRTLVTVTEEQPLPIRESVEGGSPSMNSQAGA